MNRAGGPYRIGIVGAGNISDLHYEGIRRHPDRTQVVAMCDPAETGLRERVQRFGVSATYPDVEEMIAGTRLDAAIVCTPTHVRGEVLVPLIEKGIPVLCEKPFAETYREAVAIEAAARKANVKVAVNQNFRRHFTFELAKKVLESGGLGRPLHLVQTSMMLRRDAGWRLQRARYVMAVMTIHWFDGYRCLFGAEPATVYCPALNSPATGGGPDTAISVTLSFPEDVIVSLSESFSSYTAKNMCTLDCERGGLEMGYEQLVEIRADGSRVEHTNPYDKAEATWYLLDDLLTSVEKDHEPETSAADNLKSMRILEAAYRSVNEGRVVALKEIE